MKTKINLFNHFHYGDVFLSRIIINALKDEFDITYYHNLKSPLFIDLEFVNEINHIPTNLNINRSYFESGFVNTWIGQKNMEYVTKIDKGCSFRNYIELLNDILLTLKIQKKDVTELLPFVNFEKLPNYFKIKNLVSNYLVKFKKLILISNGNVESRQSVNFNFTPIIDDLSSENPDTLFLLTQKVDLVKDNIIFTCDITETKPDLLDISFLSTFCDLIIGRSSGPYTCCLNKENILNKNKTFISFNNNEVEASYFNNEIIKCKFIWSNNYSTDNVKDIISKNL
jgi:hypothetical protein